jgi:selenocysteine lyase/cysteine desulfurase
MISRKNFLQHTTAATVSLSLFDFMKPANAMELKAEFERVAKIEPKALAADEPFWKAIREQYTLSPDLINLNNGGVSPQPIPVQEAHINHYKYCNLAPSHYMWHKLDNGREPLRKKLAELAGCSPDEIAINRNTTEGLNTIIFGLNLKAGDEVVLSKYDYPNMMNAWKQREKRDGVILKWVDFDLPMNNDEKIVALYEDAITSKTKIVHVTHMLNWTGQILPARKITDMAHSKGCEVIVDASHSFVHIDYKVTDLDCDYYATSLHKWLCAPFGTGFMFIKKDKIKNVWPLVSAYESQTDDIRKFEVLGTRSFAAEMAIDAAIDFHQNIGSKQKEERLRFLKNYWCFIVSKMSNIKLYTSLQGKYSCGIASFAIEGKEGPAIVSELFSKYKVHTTNVKHEKLNGVRVSPHIYTNLNDLDVLLNAIKEIAEQK